jgi:hypothetical protein
MADVRATRARELHQLAGTAVSRAAEHRAERNRLIRQLRADDPGRWTYAAIASEVRCSAELVALIIKGEGRGADR